MPSARSTDPVAPLEAVRSATRATWRAKLTMVVAPLCLMFAVAEIVLRAAGVPPRTATVLSTYYQTDPLLGWSGRPNVVCRFVTSGFDVEITHGPDGFRTCPGAQVDRSVDAAETVWCLGDSYVWGWGVPDGETFVDVLNRDSAPRRVFRNLGISGFGTVQEYLLLERLLTTQAAPDRVLVTFCENDPADNLEASRPRLVARDDGFEIVNTRRNSITRQCGSWLKLHSLTFNYLNFYFASAKNRFNESRLPVAPSVATTAAAVAVGGLTPRGSPVDATAEADNTSMATNDQCDITRAQTSEPRGVRQRIPRSQWTNALPWRSQHHAYRLMRDLCARHDIQFAIVWQSEMPAPVELVDIAGDLSVELLDLSGPLRTERQAAKFTGPLNLDGDSHYNATGHTLVARAISRELAAPTLARQSR